MSTNRLWGMCVCADVIESNDGIFNLSCNDNHDGSKVGVESTGGKRDGTAMILTAGAGEVRMRAGGEEKMRRRHSKEVTEGSG